MIGYTCSSSILLTHSNPHWSVSHNTNSFLLVYFGHVFASPEVEAPVDHLRGRFEFARFEGGHEWCDEAGWGFVDRHL